MVDREKVIKGLECCAIDGGCGACPYDSFKDCPGSHPNPETLMKDALALLKEQEPVKPVPAIDDVGYWLCGKCYNSVVGTEELDEGGFVPIRFNYCPNCGRKVKWE